MLKLKDVQAFVAENEKNKSASIIWLKIVNKQYLQEELGLFKYAELIESILEKLPLDTKEIDFKSQLMNEIIIIASTNMGRMKSTKLTNKLQFWFSKNNFFLNDRHLFVNIKSIILTDFHKKHNLEQLLVKVDKLLIRNEIIEDIVYIGETSEDKHELYIKEQLLNAIKTKDYNLYFQQIISTKFLNKEYYQLNFFINCKDGSWLKRSDYYQIAKSFGLIKVINKNLLKQAIKFIYHHNASTLIINQNVSCFIQDNGKVNLSALKKLSLPENSLIFKFNLKDITLYMKQLIDLSNEFKSANINICVSDFNCSKQAWKVARKINATWLELAVIKDENPTHYNNHSQRISKAIKKAHALGYKVYISKVNCNYFAADLWNLNLDYIQGDFSEISKENSNK